MILAMGILRRHGLNHRRNHGMEKEQHFRHHSLLLVRSLLAHAGGSLAVQKWGWWEGTSDNALAWYFLAWGFFTFCMFIGTLKLNRALQTVFLTLTAIFLLLAIRDWTGSEVVGKIAGWEGIVCGLSAIYAASADLE